MLRLSRHRLISVHPGRRSLSAALLAVYVFTAAGVPLPTGHVAHSDELYPCSNCACGCASAEQCWRSCCCHTLAERFAWAREHNVRPPEYAIAAAKLARLDLAWLGIKSSPQIATSASSCCRQVANSSAPRPCCQKRASAATCAGGQVCHKSGEKKSKNDGQVVMWRALACHGQSMNWLAAVPTLIVARPQESYALPVVAWLGPAHSETAERGSSSPEVPPPERA